MSIELKSIDANDVYITVSGDLIVNINDINNIIDFISKDCNVDVNDVHIAIGGDLIINGSIKNE